MARITVEDCLTKENNRFALVQLASKRTKQLLQGSNPRVERRNKSVVTALREIAGGAVRFMTPEEQAAQEEQRLRELEAARAEEQAAQERSAPGAELFSNGTPEARTAAFLRESLKGLTVTAPQASDEDEDDDEE